MKAKKVICCLVALFFIGLPVAMGEVVLLHKFKYVLGIKVIDRNGFIRYDTETGSYIEMYCPSNLHFNCIEQTCDWPEGGCFCAI